MERPILFSTPMVQAILQGRKTQTRRAVKPAVIPEADYTSWIGGKLCWNNKPCPYGKVGDILWVRETWNKHEGRYYFKASQSTLPDYITLGITEGDWTFDDLEWKPSIHMSREACRLRLRITDIRIERLREISDVDSEKEGIYYDVELIDLKPLLDLLHYFPDNEKKFSNKQAGFYLLWMKINGFKSLLSNPWVWVIEFEKL